MNPKPKAVMQIVSALSINSFSLLLPQLQQQTFVRIQLGKKKNTETSIKKEKTSI